MWRTAIEATIEFLREEVGHKGVTAHNAVQDAIECPSRMESRYDSYREEYSGRATQAMQGLNALQGAIDRLECWLKEGRAPRERTLIGTVCALAYPDGTVTHYLILPDVGGECVVTEDAIVMLVSIDSPIGQAVYGCKDGDVTYLLNGSDTEVVVTKIWRQDE